ncbi:MAG TPA: YdeI/OmpD-associated family protein [Candidatus Saccharimonadales bacterium]|nr:YdeI/OmpD-associated family protein [Candidatus Saccharimonadales bacterium]
MDAIFFESPAQFRAWLEEHHVTARELLVGLRRRGSGMPTMSWREAVDQALCFGWIDGVRKSGDEMSHTIRFTPRRPRSIWSAVNVARVEELTKRGFMRPAGIAAFEARDPARTAIYAYERPPQELGEELARQFQADATAWAFFQAQPPSYCRVAIGWVVGAKREDTRSRRFEKLLQESANGRRLGQFVASSGGRVGDRTVRSGIGHHDHRPRGKDRCLTHGVGVSHRTARGRSGSARSK